MNYANNIHESYKAQILQLSEELDKTKEALKDKTVAKDILDGNLKRILAAVNKLSAEKQALSETNKQMQKKIDDLTTKLLSYH